jgi:hypothetical protein
MSESVCFEKLQGKIMNLGLILQILYLGLDNKIFLNKFWVLKEEDHKRESDYRKLSLLI